MEIMEIDGDIVEMLLNNEVDAIAHGCNCFNTMGAGLAAQIKLNLKFASDIDNKTAKGSFHKLGDLSWSKGVSAGWVFNLYTQYYPGPEFSPEAFSLALWKLGKILELGIVQINSIAFPYIGCGIGGFADKEFIKNQIVDNLYGKIPKLYIVEYA